jgi:hypothetical protein
MPKIVNGEEYLDTTETRKVFDAPKKRFYDNIKPQLHLYRFDGKKTPWYKKREVIALKEGKPLRKATLTLAGGLQRDWTQYLRTLGYNANTETTVIQIVSLPQEAIEAFGLPADKQFVQRERMTLVDRVPICKWSTYYPVEFVGDVLDRMKTGSMEHIVEHIKDTHGVVVGYTRERHTARITTFEEEACFQSLSEEAVLVLQRVAYTADRKVLVFYSDMVLLGSWFAPEYEKFVDVWS